MCASDSKEFPPMPTPVQAFQWQVGNAWNVGTPVVVDGSQVLLIEDPCRVLMRLSHTGELVWVHEDDLDFYPPNNTPIEEPTK